MLIQRSFVSIKREKLKEQILVYDMCITSVNIENG